MGLQQEKRVLLSVLLIRQRSTLISGSKKPVIRIQSRDGVEKGYEAIEVISTFLM